VRPSVLENISQEAGQAPRATRARLTTRGSTGESCATCGASVTMSQDHNTRSRPTLANCLTGFLPVAAARSKVQERFVFVRPALGAGGFEAISDSDRLQQLPRHSPTISPSDLRLVRRPGRPYKDHSERRVFPVARCSCGCRRARPTTSAVVRSRLPTRLNARPGSPCPPASRFWAASSNPTGSPSGRTAGKRGKPKNQRLWERQ
jgi:hypothetical protein